MSNRYYTNIFRSGNYLYVREVKDGKRRRFKTEYKPTLYIPSNKSSQKFQAPDGTPVEPINPGTMGDCYQFIKKYSEVDNFSIYGNTGYEYAYLNENYPGVVEYKSSQLVIANIDIEVDSKNGYCEAKDATNEVTAITVKSSLDGIFHVFACKPFDEVAYNQEHPDSQISYHQCEDEIDLLCQFLDLWETLEPDIVTGWNIRMFDIPYLVNRISRILEENQVKRMSPWGIVKEGTVNIFNKPEIVYELAGISILDYLLIYKKNVLEPRESYRLDYIAQVELKDAKIDYGEYGTLQELYEKNFKKFVEYNIHDVRLVDRIDLKRKLIELQLLVAYHAKVNYVDVLSQVRTWDTLICNTLLEKGIVVPQKSDVDKNTQFIGAFVMKPIPGMYEWIVALDVVSLYPNIMRALNMGMETKIPLKELTPEMRRYQSYINSHLVTADDEGKMNVNPTTITQALSDELIMHFMEHEVTVAANAIFYKKSPQSLYSVMIEELFNNRVAYKKRMKLAVKELDTCTDPVRKAELETEKSIFDLKQHATKILLNSLYGAMGNQYFRFFDVQNAEAVTTTGQFLIQYIGQGMNDFLNRKLKTEGQKFVVYSDTDSVYITLKSVVDKYYPEGDVMQKTAFVDKICKEMIQPELDRLFTYVSERFLNAATNTEGKGYLAMNREIIGDKGIWTAKKRYIVNVRDKEGIRKPNGELKYMGVEIKKTTVPKFCRDAMEKAVRIVMEKDQQTLFQFVSETEAEFRKQPIENVSFPRSVNGLTKYGHPHTTYIKGTPFHTKGVLTYNRLIDQHGVVGHYPKIKDGEKMKFFYLREPNPFGVNAMAFLTTLPTEFGVEEYIDWEMQWKKSFIEPLMLILNAIKWDTQPRASISFLFEYDDDNNVTLIDPTLEQDDDLDPEDDEYDGHECEEDE